MVNKKGFTIIELLASIIILSIVIGIGIIAFRGITRGVDTNYYETLEADLLLAGNEYFANNRGDKPFEGYNSVDIVDLIDKKYIETLKDQNGKSCENIDDENSRVYIYKTDTGYDYEACLVCSEYRSTGKYCQGMVENTINISATSDDKPYNALLGYSNTSWTKANVNVTFSMTNAVSSYDIVDLSSNEKTSCTNIIDNRCTKEMSKSSSYRVIAMYNGSEIARSNFNLKIDKVKPTVMYTKEGGYYNGESLSFQVKPVDDNLIDDYDVLINRAGTSTTIASYNNQKASELTITLNNEGSYDVLTQVRDKVGNVSAASSSDTVYNKYYLKRYILDKTLPTCTLTSSLSSIDVGGTTTVTMNCTDANSIKNPPTLTINDFTSWSTLQITGVSGPVSITNGVKYTITVKGLTHESLKVGRVTIKANRIRDNAGNYNEQTSTPNITVNPAEVCKYRYNMTRFCEPAGGDNYNMIESSGYTYNSSTDAMNACQRAASTPYSQVCKRAICTGWASNCD